MASVRAADSAGGNSGYYAAGTTAARAVKYFATSAAAQRHRLSSLADRRDSVMRVVVSTSTKALEHARRDSLAQEVMVMGVDSRRVRGGRQGRQQRVGATV